MKSGRENGKGGVGGGGERVGEEREKEIEMGDGFWGRTGRGVSVFPLNFTVFFIFIIFFLLSSIIY